MKRTLYIAYGSNLDKCQMIWRCPGAKPIAVSKLKDHRLVFQGSAFGAHANVIPEKGKEVPVAIWEIGTRDEASLDRYEGVRGGYYTKEYMEVEVNGRPETALIYIMTPHGYGIPTDQYLDTIRQGYHDFRLGIQPLNEALVYSFEQAENRKLAR